MDEQPTNTAPHGQVRGTLRRAESLTPGFTQIPNWLKDVKGVSRDAKLTFIYLLQYSWQKDECFPGMDTLADDLDASRQSVTHWIKELRLARLVRVERRGLGLTNVYHLLDPRAADVNPGLHPERRKSLHPESSESFPLDVKQAVRKEYPVKEYPVVSSSVENNDVCKTTTARGRESPSSPPPPISLALPEWTASLVERLDSALVLCALSAVQRRDLAGVLMRLLGTEAPELRERFVSYVLSSDHLQHTEVASRVAAILEEDWGGWVRRGKPATKAVPAALKKDRKGRGSGPLPAARPWRSCCRTREGQDHDAHTCRPTILRIAESVRKYKGDDDADAYLQAHGIFRDDDDDGR